MKKVLYSALVLFLLSACSSEEKESDKILSNYKNRQLEKAEQVEDKLNERVDSLNQQIEKSTTQGEPEDDQ